MAVEQRETEQLAPLPGGGVRCPARSAPRAPHEWAPQRASGYYCTACLSQLMPADVQDWKLLLELELSRGEAALSGDAYATLSEMIAKTLPLAQSECRILRRLGAEPSYVVRHGELAEALWGGSAAATHDRGGAPPARDLAPSEALRTQGGRRGGPEHRLPAVNHTGTA